MERGAPETKVSAQHGKAERRPDMRHQERERVKAYRAENPEKVRAARVADAMAEKAARAARGPKSFVAVDSEGFDTGRYFVHEDGIPRDTRGAENNERFGCARH